MNDPSVLALGATVLQSNINSAAAQAAGIRSPYPGFTGNVAQALRKYPQYQNIQWRGVPMGESQYHALETVLERRFSRGLQARVAYTFSKLHNNGAENAQGSDGDQRRGSESGGPARVVPQCGRYAACVPGRLHLGSAWLRELVLGCRKGSACGLERQWRAPIRERAAVQHRDGQRSWRLPFQWPEAAEPCGRRRRRDREWRLRSQHRPVLQSRRPGSDPGPLQFGNAPRRDSNGARLPELQRGSEYLQGLPLPNGQRIRFETSFGNLFNRTLFCEPANNWSAANFGQVFSQANSPRSIQLALRYDF